MLKSIIYVSRMVIPEIERVKSISCIVKASRDQNTRFCITGALIASKSLFAGIIEGPPDHIDDLMALLRRDPRHKHVKVMQSAINYKREFIDWNIVYNGDTPYIDKHLQAMSDDFGGLVDKTSVQILVELMLEFRKRLR